MRADKRELNEGASSANCVVFLFTEENGEKPYLWL